jgi:integrase
MTGSWFHYLFCFPLILCSLSEAAKAVEPDLEGSNMPQKQITFKAMADQYLTLSGSRHSQSYHKSIKTSLERDILPLWADTPIADIRRADGRHLVTSLATQAHHRAAIANKVIRAVFAIALDEGHIEENPMLGFSKYIPKPKAASRRRVLSPMEIKAVWSVVSKGPEDEACKRALKLMLVTGQRLSAIVSMHRSEINGECWTIPPERCHSRYRPHRVFLSPLALDVIGDGDGYIFPSTDPTRPVNVNAVARLISAKRPTRSPYCGLAPWVSYDLRRTVAHQMLCLGVSEEAVGAVLGYAQRSVCGLYPTYNPEIKAALLKWESELLQLIDNKPTSVPPSMPSLTAPTFGL